MVNIDDLRIGDVVWIGELRVEVDDIYTFEYEDFINTEYGDFNVDVITRVET